ncbi:hypothetical protein SAMN05428949_2477 [Chitinophaga sp. YR627]|uniref:coiled-coil domain-containing protein n=1 Tax=Chitinophaga sp. YR627 TaxID=1881041 RepID=UPI0008E02618|nr:hypothetical protein [Chitinophaga sp. YR627]SFN33684.1 hypothetical protein SAMN05428949_2477 [Chitinophaga sp. YR627]
MKHILFILFITLIARANIHGQTGVIKRGADYYSKWKIKPSKGPKNPLLADTLLYFSTGEKKFPAFIIAPYQGTAYDTVIVSHEKSKKKQQPVMAEKQPLLTVHGNVLYDFFYQSNVDTPFVQKDVHQHTLQTSLEFTYKNYYPIRVNFTTRKGNSSLFRNLTDINLQYTSRDFRNAMLQKAKSWDASKYAQLDSLQRLKGQLVAMQSEIDKLKAWKSDPASLQKLVEAREKIYYAKIRDSLKLDMPGSDIDPGMNSFQKIVFTGFQIQKARDERKNADSTLENINNRYADNEEKLDSLQERLAALQALYNKQEKVYATRKNALNDALTRSKNNKELAENLEKAGLPDTVLPEGYKQLLAIRTIGVGRMLVDYSELTAKNISILGFQAEYNPGYYYAVATGKVDYRFRDFVFNENRSRQYLNLIRVGKGIRDGNNIILSYYTGRKQVYNFNTVDENGTTTTADLSQHIMGLSIESRWQVDQNNYITGEIAKSSLPAYARSVTDHNSGLNEMFRLSDHTNEAYSIKAGSFLQQTGTRISAMYKMMGANFQSFSLYSTGSSQTGWSVKVDQLFFKKQLTISAGIRKNDFVTNYQQTNYQSNTVFKSVQATLRKKKWPVITAGYFPSAQLTKLNDGHYSENLFYNLVGTVSHFYYFRGIMMSTLATYTQFYNKQTDSNFLYFNSKDLLLSQTIFTDKFTINGGGSIATNPEYDLYGASGNVQYKMRTWLELGAGAKYNYQTTYRLTQIGYSGNARISIRRLGEIALMGEKAFVPGGQKRLVSSDNGRITYTKTF